MTVGAECDVDGGVPQSLHDCSRMSVCGYHKSGSSMPQVMEPGFIWESRPQHRRFEMLAIKIAPPQRPARRGPKYIVINVAVQLHNVFP